MYVCFLPTPRPPCTFIVYGLANPSSPRGVSYFYERSGQVRYGGIRRNSASPRPPYDGTPSASVWPSPRQNTLRLSSIPRLFTVVCRNWWIHPTRRIWPHVDEPLVLNRCPLQLWSKNEYCMDVYVRFSLNKNLLIPKSDVKFWPLKSQ